MAYSILCEQKVYLNSIVAQFLVTEVKGCLFWFNVDEHTNVNLTSFYHGVQEYEPYTCNGSVDIKGNPASKKHTGKWRACYSILGNQTLVPIFFPQSAVPPTNLCYLFMYSCLENFADALSSSDFFFLCESLFLEGGEFCGSLAYYGVGTNLVSYLTKVRKQSNVTAASNIASWQGTCYLTPLLGAFLADSYWGRHRTIVVSLTIFTIVTLDRHSTLFFVKSASAC
jgi:peptide/histidine transporter 3/4